MAYTVNSNKAVLTTNRFFNLNHVVLSFYTARLLTWRSCLFVIAAAAAAAIIVVVVVVVVSSIYLSIFVGG